ncbi:cupin domain-containing protein [Streptomyces sp. 6N223]|uniref:cupin domain-containing protein n=1 Tax=Streptomyces sp. 6N223 TaxID=3457412 RepID=UPI003FD21AE2
MTAPQVAMTRLADGVLAPSDSGLVLAEWTAEGATNGEPPVYQAPLHLHEEDEAWYVLDGALRVRVGEEEVEVSAGGAVVVPGGTPHTYYNPRPEPARYVLVMGARTWALIQAIHSAGDRGSEAMRELFARYGARLLEE